MPHLAVFREGWTNERFAELVLSQIAFVAQPTTVADDIGADFHRTLFDAVEVDGRKQLLPNASFVVQVKSNDAPVSLTKYLPYLARLEVPFFIAVPDRRRRSLRLFSGRYLPYLLAFRGPHLSSLTAQLSRKAKATKSGLRSSVRGGPKRVALTMPRLVTLPANARADLRRDAVTLLAAECRETGLNIFHRLTEQFVFSFAEGKVRTVLAGIGSARVFRANFGDRLLEYCRNLLWLHRFQPDRVSVTELREVITLNDVIGHRLPASDARERALDELRSLVKAIAE